MMEWSLVFSTKQTKNPKLLWKKTKENNSSIIFILGQAVWKQVSTLWLKPDNIAHQVYQDGKHKGLHFKCPQLLSFKRPNDPWPRP